MQVPEQTFKAEEANEGGGNEGGVERGREGGKRDGSVGWLRLFLRGHGTREMH